MAGKEAGAGPASVSDHSVWSIDHIKKLPDADKAEKLLQEVKRHSDPLLRARGWRVKKLYEICCCTSGGKNLGVGGFCMPAGDGVTSRCIALRLRKPHSHELHSFEHCMRVMIHEMSHIVHGNHSAQFYQMMEELSKQYETFLAKGQVLDEQGMPMVGGVKMDGERHNPRAEARSLALQAAEARAKKGALMGGGKLGGGGGGAGDWRGKTPGEMAAAAAATRMRAWDLANGLHDDELDAARQWDEDEDECSIVPPPFPRPTAAPTPGSVTFAPRGKGAWQAVACPVCGPSCSSSRHGPDDPPPQDEDEGAVEGDADQRGSGSAGSSSGNGSGRTRGEGCSAGSSTGGSAGGRGGRGGAAVAGGQSARGGGPQIVEIDLTGSDDEVAPAPKRPRDSKATVLQEVRGGNRGWACPTCTFVNSSTSIRCEMDCGGERPAAGKTAWSCKQCTFTNAADKTHCDACGSWRYHRPLP